MSKKQLEEESVKFGLRREDVLCRSKWIVGVNLISVGLRSIWPPSLVGDTTRLKHIFFFSIYASYVFYFLSADYS